MSNLILTLFEPRVARVLVFDSGRRHTRLGRFAIAKHMICSDGTFRITQAYRKTHSAAVSYAHRWFETRTAQGTERATMGSEVAA